MERLVYRLRVASTAANTPFLCQRTITLHTTANLRQGLLDQTKELKLSQQLTSFPNEILELSNTLEVLDLSNNQLSQLPCDFARLKKLRVLFLSNNQFKELPSVLAECPALSMIGIRNNQMKVVPEHSLPLTTRWLILTDNQIKKMPDSLGQLPYLQKLMLAGNQLTALPDTIAQCHSLELFRVSANQLTNLPDSLLHLPKLSWLAFSGNPFCDSQAPINSTLPAIAWSDIDSHEILGQGASGIISKATWRSNACSMGGTNLPIVVKKYKGSLTSDGYSKDELAAVITADCHPNLIPLVAQIDDDCRPGLVMQRISKDYKCLGQPPSMQSCTRDQFNNEFTLAAPDILKAAIQVADTMLHLLEKKICHGDLYAHNILINQNADIILSDFGAASSYDSLTVSQSESMQKIEVRAFGCLLEDLLTICKHSPSALTEQLTALKKDCLLTTVAARPTFKKIKLALTRIHSHQGDTPVD